MSDDADTGASRGALLRAGLFAGIAALISVDLATDYRDGVGWGHIILESVILVLAAVGAVQGWRRYIATRADLVRLDADLESVRAQAEGWRAEHASLVRGLGAAIESQFAQWALTTAETEIGLLLLKGLSLKEIANLRATSERTVREQARSVYRKAGLAGRAELSAFFLEDLLSAAPEAA